MAGFRNVSNDFLNREALLFFKNFLNNHKYDINDRDLFAIIDENMSNSKCLSLLKNNFNAKEIKYLNMKDFNEDLFKHYSIKVIWGKLWEKTRVRTKVKNILINYCEQLLSKKQVNSRSDIFAKKFKELIGILKLSDMEAKILLVTIAIDYELLCVVDAHNRNSNNHDIMVFIAKCLDCPLREINSLLDVDKKLKKYMLVDDNISFNGSLLNDFLQGINAQPLISKYYTIAQNEVLPWNFYGNLVNSHGDILKDLISKNRGKRGVNILLYGEPGTGKTSFAQTLAKELKLDCYMINQIVHNDSSPAFRFGSLQICANRVDNINSLIVVDEADDMLQNNNSIFASFLGRKQPNSGDKGRLNATLDSIQMPTIWISNNQADELDESSRRRFDYSICFEKLSFEQCLTIWQNNIKKFKLEKLVTPDMLNLFAQKYATNAGGIALALQNVVNLNPTPASVEKMIDKLLSVHCQLLNIKTTDDKLSPSKDYSLEGLKIKGNIALSNIIEAIKNFQNDSSSMDRPRMNLLLSGVPGSGKTEFVKFLSSQLKTKLVVKNGSDLLSMYVGGTEHNIKQAFDQAEQEKSILFLDEIDGFVQSRKQAQRSWEVTQVNELLQQIENFNGIFIGSTNFSQYLDSAILRRFTFKLEFDYLDNSGKKSFFERMFKTTLSDKECQQLNNIPYLTPGDFRTVRQSLYYLNNSITNLDRLEALEQESIVKSNNKFANKKAGF